MGNLLVWLPDELHMKFRHETRKKGLSMSNEIRQLIEKWLEENDKYSDWLIGKR